MPDDDQTQSDNDQTQSDNNTPVQASSDQTSIPNDQNPNIPPDANTPSQGVVAESVGQQPQSFDLQGPTTPQETRQYLAKESADWANDLQNQHITPKTYNSLFENQDTLGKVSTIFSLIAGGMGAGLTGGPNTGLQMMDNVIKNDLQAQMQSKQNAQNFIRLNQEHQLQQVQQGLYGAQTDLAKNQAAMFGTQLGNIQMNQVVLHHLSQQVQQAASAANADPTNSQKAQQAQQMQQAFGIISQGMNNENSSVADRAAGMMSLINSANPQAAAAQQQSKMPENPQGVDINRLQQLSAVGKLAPNTPGVLNPQDAASANSEAQQVLVNRQLLNMYRNTYSDLNNSYLAGKWNPTDYETKTELVADQMAHQLGLGHDDKEKVKSVLFPSATDFGTTRADKFKQGQEDFQVREAGTPTLDRYGLKSPIQIQPLAGQAPQQSQGLQEGQTGKTKDGRSVVVKNGKWVPQ